MSSALASHFDGLIQLFTLPKFPQPPAGQPRLPVCLRICVRAARSRERLELRL